MSDLPTSLFVALQGRAVRLLDRRKAGTDLRSLARELLVEVFDLCMHSGHDKLLDELARAFPPIDVADRTGLADHETLSAALVEQLGTIDLDGGGPRNARPRQLADCVVAALGLTIVNEPDRSILLGDDIRVEVVAVVTSVVDAELAAPKIREDIIAEARARCDQEFHSAFAKIAAQLDDRGWQVLRQPKLPIHAVHAVQQALFEGRNAVVARVVGAAIDRAKGVLAGADPDAAARIDLPITLRATPRDVVISRAWDSRVGKTATTVVPLIVDSLTELLRIRWRPPEKPVHPYAATGTFAVGDLIDHPKFGRGAVVSCLARRIDVEFADGMHTLVHVPPRR